jgi:MFS family permease
VPPQRRGVALGIWGAVGGLAVAIGPLGGGAVAEGASWQWIFWLNVTIGVALAPVARTRLTESRGPSTRLDLTGVVLASLGLLGIVLGVVRGNAHGWTSVTVLPPIVIGAMLVAAFAAWELRGAVEPMLPMRLFRSRGFTMTNAASLLMFFGMFGPIFLLASRWPGNPAGSRSPNRCACVPQPAPPAAGMSSAVPAGADPTGHRGLAHRSLRC